MLARQRPRDQVTVQAPKRSGGAYLVPAGILQLALFFPPALTSPRWFESATGPGETA
jgi:hypothetical protein